MTRCEVRVCVAFVLLLGCGSAFVREQKFVKREGFRLLDHTFEVRDVRSALGCNRRCLENPACVSVNYSPPTGECQLCDETPEKYGTKLEVDYTWTIYHAKGPCEAGWIYYGTSCYWLETSTATWSDSAAHCATLGTRLLEINDQQENDFVYGIQQGAGLTTQMWHGLNDIADEGVFVWPSGAPVNFLNFGTDEGENGDEDCMCIGTLSTWGDLGCTRMHPSMCEQDLYPSLNLAG